MLSSPIRRSKIFAGRSAILAAMIGFTACAGAGPGWAQAPTAPPPDKAVPPEKVLPPDRSVPGDPAPEPGNRSSPIIKPPANVDPGMAKPPPNPTTDNTPIIKPPPNPTNPAIPK